MKITEEQYEELADKLETAIDSQTEYACEHSDAGNAYAHMFREGGWSYSNGPDRLKDWLLDHHGITLTDSQFEELEDEALDWCWRRKKKRQESFPPVQWRITAFACVKMAMVDFCPTTIPTQPGKA